MFTRKQFLSEASLTVAYLGWAVLRIALVFGLAGVSFQRRDL